jgi:hypothetical protein
MVLAAGCGDDGGAAGAGDELPATGCGEDRQERVDPGSAAHVLAGAADPGPDAYATDPPTSGPHTPGPPRSGVLDEPLTRPEQVGHLEAGGILVQHAGLTDAQVAELAQVAGGGVAVVPNPDLSAPIVVTAWLRTMPCSTPDTEALQEFVTVHQGQAPGSDG